MSKSLEYLTLLQCDEGNPYHTHHIEEFYNLCSMMIEERTPEIVKQEIDKLNEYDITANVQTYINGKPHDFEDVREYVRKVVVEEVIKAFKGLKI